MVPEWYRDKPLVDGTALLSEPLFWLNHLAACVQKDAHETMFGADWEVAEEFFYARMASHDKWPVLTADLSCNNAIHVVYRNPETTWGSTTCSPRRSGVRS